MQTHRAASAAKRDISKLLHALRHICADFSRLSNDRTAIIAFVNLLNCSKIRSRLCAGHGGDGRCDYKASKPR